MTAASSLLLGSCVPFHLVDPEQPCLEAGYAIAAVTEECTADRDLANSRYEAFEAGWDCIPRPPNDPEIEALGVDDADLYDCAFAIGQLPCEVVEDFGDDIAAYLAISPACPLVVEPAGATP